MKGGYAWLPAVLFALAFAGTARSQTTFATITGTVTDASGSVVPKAAIEAIGTETGYRYSTESNQSGVYTLPNLREGTYRLHARLAGLRDFVAVGIELKARDVRRIDVNMDVATVETAIEVSAGATVIETETARLSDTKSADTIRSMPLNSRGVHSYLMQTSGVFNGSGSSIRFNGSRSNQEDETVDGISFNNGWDATQIVSGNFIESYQEMRVDVANNTAQYGSVGQLTLISKSGTNKLRGSLFDYYASAGLSARNPFALERTSSVSHAPGVSIGGPVYLPKVYDGRNKTFFFYTYEAYRGSAIRYLVNPTVAIPSWRVGDFSGLAPGTVIKDPTTGTPFAGNLIPASRINPVSQKIQDRYFPLPNTGNTSVFQSQNYQEVLTRPYEPNTQWTGRIDHRVTEKAFVFVRYAWFRQEAHNGPESLPTIKPQWRQRDARNLTVSYSQTLRPNLLNEIRFGYANNDNPRYTTERGLEAVNDFGFVGLAPDLPDTWGMPNVSFSGIGLTRASVAYNYLDPGFQNRVKQFQEELSWFRGRHSVKVGVNLSRVGFAQGIADGCLFGCLVFSNRFTNQPYADFLLGIPSTVTRGFPTPVQQRLRWAYDFFASDSFKLTPNLTLDLGVRWEYHPSWIDTQDLQAVFDIGTGKIVVPDGALAKVSPLMPRGYVGVIEAKEAGLPSRTLVKQDVNNWAPRVGFAYRPWGNNTVLRAGYGIFYDVVPRAITAASVPFAISEPAYTNPAAAPDVILPRVFPSTSVGGPATTGIPFAQRSDLRTPYSMQYNLTIEHQRWGTGFRISYVGTNTRQGEYTYNINQPVPDTRAYINKPRLFPQYPAITYLTNGAGHQYNSLGLELRRPLANGLTYRLGYELSRDIGDLERGQAPENAYDRQRERAVWETMPTHRATGHFIYELPFGKGKALLAAGGRTINAILGGWELSGAYVQSSGRFLTPLWSGPDPVGATHTTSSTPAIVTLRPNILRDPNLPTDERFVQRWFDTGAFGAPTSGYYGTSAKGVIKGPGIAIFNAGLAKYLTLAERLKLRCEFTATNVFNHPNWGNPATTISNANTVGRITGTSGISWDAAGARNVRMGVRLEW